MTSVNSFTDLTITTSLSGEALLRHPRLNKGSAFSPEERREFGLTGLVPLHTSTIEQQLVRTYAGLKVKPSNLEKYIYLAALQDRNETLFYRLAQEHITEITPILYTPTVGEACQKFSHIFRRARGLYVSYPERDQLKNILHNIEADDIRVVVATDGERVLGLGDQGVGGMGIPIGKLTLYTLCAGVAPWTTLPVLIDVGTNNPDLLNDPLYLGWRHPRLERAEYDAFIDQFVDAIKERWPRVVLQWEDFAKDNAQRLLERHVDRIASFNDDIQGTAAVAVAGILRASRVLSQPITEMQTVIYGAGSASTGIAELLCGAWEREGRSREEARRSIWLLDSRGLVHDGRKDLSEEKKKFSQSLERMRTFRLTGGELLDLQTIVENVHPTTLVGVSGQPGSFTEKIVRTMASHVERPVIFPLSNPTSKSEATPEQIIAWTDGRALVATGSPFPAVEWNGRRIPIGQCNNAFIFPGLGLGVVSSEARHIPNSLFLSAASVLASFDLRLPGHEDALFPNLEHVRQLSELIAVAVTRDLVTLDLAATNKSTDDVPALVRSNMWEPVYPNLRKLGRTEETQRLFSKT